MTESLREYTPSLGNLRTHFDLIILKLEQGPFKELSEGQREMILGWYKERDITAFESRLRGEFRELVRNDDLILCLKVVRTLTLNIIKFRQIIQGTIEAKRLVEDYEL